MEIKNIRIGNIEIRPYFNVNSKIIGKIVCYYPNPTFGKEKEYKWTEDGEFAYKEGVGIKHHKSCFVNPESRYVIAFIEQEKEDEEPDLRTVGSRMFNLEKEDFKDFVSVCKYMYDNFTN